MAKRTARYAHFSGGGPAGETCRSCCHMEPWPPGGKAQRPICARAATLMGVVRADLDSIEPGSPACKYWGRRVGP